MSARARVARRKHVGAPAGRIRTRSPISIVVLSRNHAPFLKRSLPVIAAQVRHKRTDLIAFDTASTDGSAALLANAGFSVHPVDPAGFGHGRTRNAAASCVAGGTVVFLNGDAVPADGWLNGLLDGFALHPRVAGVFSRQAPPPGTDPLRVADLAGHPAFGSDLPRVSVLGEGGLPADPARRRATCTFDTVSCAIRTAALRDIPFPDAPFGEDLLWGRAVLEAGLAVAYAPASVVEHCHDLYADPMDLVRRHFSDAALESMAAGRTIGAGPVSFARFMAGAVGRDLREIARAKMDPGAKAVWAAFGPAARALQFFAVQAGYASPLLPAAVTEFLSWKKRS